MRGIVAWADSIEAGLAPECARPRIPTGSYSGAAEFLSLLDLAVIRRGLLGEDPAAEISDFRSRLLCRCPAETGARRLRWILQAS